MISLVGQSLGATLPTAPPPMQIITAYTGAAGARNAIIRGLTSFRNSIPSLQTKQANSGPATVSSTLTATLGANAGTYLLLGAAAVGFYAIHKHRAKASAPAPAAG